MRLFTLISLISIIFPFQVIADSATFSCTTEQGYFTITSDNTKVDNANDNLMYDLSNAPAGFWEADPTAGTIRVSDNSETNMYSYEVENFSDNGSSGTGIVFFDSSLLQTGSDTTWRIYVCNGESLPAASATLGSQNVWNANYVGVWHMSGGSGANESDSTSNGNDLTDNNTIGTATGKIGSGRDFGGSTSNDYFRAAHDASMNFGTGGFTVQEWHERDTTGARMSFMSKRYNNGDTDNGNFWEVHYNSGDTFSLDLVGSGGTFAPDSTDSTTATVFEKVDITYDGGTGWAVYLDGSSIAVGSDVDDPGNYDNAGHDFTIGVTDSGENEEFDGVIDEARLHSGALSANWLSTEYNNMNSPITFWTEGAWTAAAQEVTTTTSFGIRGASVDIRGGSFEI